MTFKVGVIFACDLKGGIGFEGKMPWHAPGDLKQFKMRTLGKPIIMGRKTWESFDGRMLPDRPHIVIASQQVSIPLTGLQQFHIASDYADALYQAMQYGDEAWVIGGAALIEQAMLSASYIRITQMKGLWQTDVRIKKSALDRVYANRLSMHEIKSLETDMFTVTEYLMA